MREIPGGSCPHFRIYRPVSGIRQIRQIHPLYLPHCFHWRKPLKSPDWIIGGKKVLFRIQDTGEERRRSSPGSIQKTGK
jgi:hypothetical protein